MTDEELKRLRAANPVGMPDPDKARQAWDGAQNGEMDRLKDLGQQAGDKFLAIKKYLGGS